MATTKKGKLKGFTLVELMISLVIMGISVSAIGAVIVDSQNGWSRLYNRVNADVVTDGYVAKKKFDAVVRKASSETISLDSNKNWVEVYYYSSDSATVIDSYAKFFISGDDLMIEHGTLNPKATSGYETICDNVSSCTFDQSGRSVQMFLKLDNGTQANTIITSAVTNN
jgi:prepilin-type N-terminal cleavage/methylation domain-containing protein